jgi:glycosyltransferase involved in cell wall biosynthesis
VSCDLLLVSLGTTHGLRVADAAFLEQVRGAGGGVAAVTVRIGALDRLRRGYPVNDLVEAAAARRALRAGLRRSPRAVVFSTVTAAMGAPRLSIPYAVRLDSPAALNRPGLRNRVLHALERRALGRARLVLPWSRAALAALPEGAERAVVLPPPVVPSGVPAEERERLAVAYVPDPKAKGLTLLCAAWARAAPADARLAVFGIEPERARRHLARFGPEQPAGVEWRGLLPEDEFRAALRRCRAFVHAATWEDFGQAPLEALADGALLVTAPSAGAYEALALARDLDPELVAPALDPDALAACVRGAFELSEADARTYRERAADLLAPYRPEALEETARERVLPALLGDNAAVESPSREGGA